MAVSGEVQVRDESQALMPQCLPWSEARHTHNRIQLYSSLNDYSVLLETPFEHVWCRARLHLSAILACTTDGSHGPHKQSLIGPFRTKTGFES